MIQGPNRLSPIDDATALQKRRDWVLERMAELGWAEQGEVKRALAEPVKAKPSPPRSSAPRHFVSWVAELVAREESSRVKDGRGFLVETTLDPWLQELAEGAVRQRLADLRRRNASLRGAGLTASPTQRRPTSSAT